MVATFSLWCTSLHACLIEEWKCLLTPVSFGGVQMLVWLAKKNVYTQWSMKYFSAYLFQQLACPSKNNITGCSWSVGSNSTKCFAYVMKTSCVILPLFVVSTFTSGMLLRVIDHCNDVPVSVGVLPLCCLTLSSASFSFDFDLSVWIRTGPQAPSTIPFATSQYSPLHEARHSNLQG